MKTNKLIPFNDITAEHVIQLRVFSPFDNVKLVISILFKGLINPIMVEPIMVNGIKTTKYQVVNGFRRYKSICLIRKIFPWKYKQIKCQIT